MKLILTKEEAIAERKLMNEKMSIIEENDRKSKLKILKEKWSIKNVIKHFGKKLETRRCGVDVNGVIFENTKTLLEVKINNILRDDFKEFEAFYCTYNNDKKDIEGFSIQEHDDSLNTIIVNDLGLDVWEESEDEIKLIELTFSKGILLINTNNNTFTWKDKGEQK